MNKSTSKSFGRGLILACLISLGLNSSAQAQTSWWDSFTESAYHDYLRPALAPRRAPTVYPHPQTGQPVPWERTRNRGFYYGGSGIRG